MEFDLQRFDDEQPTDTEPETSDDEQSETGADEQQLPEELNGLPEEYARETLAEWEQIKSTQEPQPESRESAPIEKPPVTREQYQAVINELNQLKAQFAAMQPKQAQQPQQLQPPQLRITPEMSARINEAITAEAMKLSGLTKDDVAKLDYAEEDDPRIAQWNQAKSIAQSNVFSAIRQTQLAQQFQAQRFYNEHTVAMNSYNEFVKKEFAEPDFKAIQNFATNDFFEQLQPDEQKIIASSYMRVERQTASPAEILVVKKYYERAKAAYRSRNAKPKQAPMQQAAKLPRSDQLKGSSTTSDGQLSAADIEKLLTQDFTTLTPKQQKMLLGLTS